MIFPFTVCLNSFNSYEQVLKHFEIEHKDCDESQQNQIKVQRQEMESEISKNKLGRYLCLFCPSRKNLKFATDKESKLYLEIFLNYFSINLNLQFATGYLREHMQNHPTSFHYCLDSSEQKLRLIKPRGDLDKFTVKINSLILNEEKIYEM